MSKYTGSKELPFILTNENIIKAHPSLPIINFDEAKVSLNLKNVEFISIEIRDNKIQLNYTYTS